MDYALTLVATEADWRALHELRRATLFAPGRHPGIVYDDNPAPTDAISIERVEFDGLCAALEADGIPLKADRDQAWLDYCGWRVNYDAVLLALCSLVMAPPAPWSSDRMPTRRPRPRLLRMNRAAR